MDEKTKKILVYSIAGIVIATLLYIAVKAIAKRNKEVKKEKLLSEATSIAITPNKTTYGAEAVKLEGLIFNKHSKLYGWESDTDEILKMFANYNKEEVDKVLTAYSTLFQKGKQGGSYLGYVVPGLDYLAYPIKEYTGSAFTDLESIEDKEDYNKIVFAYNNLK